MSPEDTAVIKETLADIDPKPRTGWVIIRGMTTERIKLTIKLFELLSKKSSDLFSDITLAKRLYTYSEMVRRRFYELYLKQYLAE